MLIGVAIAVVPLVATSRREVRHIAADFEQSRARRHDSHEGHRHKHVPHRQDRSAGLVPVATEGHRWYEPVLVRHVHAVARQD